VAPACTAKNSSSTIPAEAAPLPQLFGGALAPRMIWRGEKPEAELHQMGPQLQQNF